MFDFTKKYEKIKNYANICKYDKALQIVQELENNLELTMQNHFLVKLEQSRILNLKAKFQDSIEISLKYYQKCQIEGFSVISLDFIIESVRSYFRLGKLEKSLEYFEMGHKILSNLSDITQKERAKHEAMLGYYYSAILWRKGKYENSIPLVDELLQKQKKFSNHKEMARLLVVKSVLSNAQGQIEVGLNCLFEARDISRENNDISHLTVIYNNIGWIYERIGKFNEALNYLKKSSEIISKTENISLNCAILDNIGNIYRQLGDLDQSQQYLLQAINLGEKLGNNFKMTHYYFDIIRTLLEQKNIEQAQQYLLKFGKIVDIENSKAVIFRYKIAQALVLKESHRARDRYQAQTILLDLVKEADYDYNYMIDVIINLCDLLITDLQITNEQEIITEINELITRLQKIAEKYGSHSLFGESFLLRAKLSLVTLDLIGSRELLIKAQKIAEKNGLTNLAIHVSNEHDYLLKEESKLLEMKNSNAGLTERIQYSGIHKQISIMNLEKGYKESEVKEEQPLLFVIMNETGIALYKYSFSHLIQIDGQLLSGFLSAINSFCTEFLSGSFDRAKIGDNFLALARSPPFVICYIFKGNSYLAQKKIKNFLKKFDENQFRSKDILSYSFRYSCIVNKEDSINIKNLLFNSFQLSD
jgi:tetratricopeptide (TPR) repeat protein